MAFELVAKGTRVGKPRRPAGNVTIGKTGQMYIGAQVAAHYFNGHRNVLVFVDKETKRVAVVPCAAEEPGSVKCSTTRKGYEFFVLRPRVALLEAGFSLDKSLSIPIEEVEIGARKGFAVTPPED